MLTDGIIAARHRRANLVTAFLGQVDDGLRVAETTFYPFLDLAIRLWLAQLFWVSGLLKLADWDNALRLATYEYPVAWLDPATAAALGIAIEVICPVLLALGLATRLAAIPLLILTLVTQFEYQALDQHFYQAALFGGYIVMGAGPLALDRLLGPGLVTSALPLARPLARLYAAISRRRRVWLQPPNSRALTSPTSSRRVWKAAPNRHPSDINTWAISPPSAGRRPSWIWARSG